MISNYFVLNRIILELNEFISSYKLIEVFSQEKDKVIFHFNNNDNNFFLELSCQSNLNFITLIEKYFKAKKNTINFFQKYLPSSLKQIQICKYDRIIKFNFTLFDIYFLVRRGDSNLILIDNNNDILTFKNVDKEKIDSLKNEIINLKFSSDFHIPNFVEDDFSRKDVSSRMDGFAKRDSFEEFPNDFPNLLRTKYPIISKEIIDEIKIRNLSTQKSYKEILLEVINEIKKIDFAIFSDENKNLFLAPKSFKLYTELKKTEFDNIFDAINFYLKQNNIFIEFNSKSKLIEKYLDKEISYLSKNISDLSKKIEQGSKEQEYYNIGNLLLMNLNKFNKGLNEIDFENIFSDNKVIKIKLKQELSPVENANYYFEKAKKEKISLEKSKFLFAKNSTRLNYLLKIKNNFINSQTIDDLNKIIDELKLQKRYKTQTKREVSMKYRHYIINDKYDLYVGKDAKSNDELTLKFAKQNDLFFHARDVSGSHTILKVHNTKENIPKEILKIVASVAAFYSKAKTSSLVPVTFTQRKYVTKHKGMEPGKVAVMKEDVLLVKPEIPLNCKLISDE
ncbi:MAG: NFACT RNA binding domain-containing protein [Ignavibacterium sp.]